MTNRNLLAATALQTGAFIFFASATPSFAQTFKGKAKSAGEDIITPLVQQASTAIAGTVAK